MPDSELFKELMAGKGEDAYHRGVVVDMLREMQDEGIYSHQHAKEFIGRSFREKLRYKELVQSNLASG